MSPETGRQLFFALIALVALERGVEMLLSARNARIAVARGAVEAESRLRYAAMVAVHALFLAAAPLEVVLLDRPFVPALAVAMTVVVGAAMALRYWAIATLGERWNTRVLVIPGLPAVAGGPYRYLRHPNYVAVTLEVAALPLVHGAWWTALGWSLASALLLAVRIPREEAALTRHADYDARLGDRRRFVPGAPRDGDGAGAR